MAGGYFWHDWSVETLITLTMTKDSTACQTMDRWNVLQHELIPELGARCDHSLARGTSTRGAGAHETRRGRTASMVAAFRSTPACASKRAAANGWNGFCANAPALRAGPLAWHRCRSAWYELPALPQPGIWGMIRAHGEDDW